MGERKERGEERERERPLSFSPFPYERTSAQSLLGRGGGGGGHDDDNDVRDCAVQNNDQREADATVKTRQKTVGS